MRSRSVSRVSGSSGAAKDWANCHATADVVVADETILEDGPVTYLLSLEHQLTEVLGFMRALQLTDPAEDEGAPPVSIGAPAWASLLG
jgi:hypothetical protein